VHDFALTMASGALRRVLWCSMTGSYTRQTAPLPDLAARSALVAACIRSPYRRHRGVLGNTDADTQADVVMKQRFVKARSNCRARACTALGSARRRPSPACNSSESP